MDAIAGGKEEMSDPRTICEGLEHINSAFNPLWVDLLFLSGMLLETVGVIGLLLWVAWPVE